MKQAARKELHHLPRPDEDLVRPPRSALIGMYLVEASIVARKKKRGTESEDDEKHPLPRPATDSPNDLVEGMKAGRVLHPQQPETETTVMTDGTEIEIAIETIEIKTATVNVNVKENVIGSESGKGIETGRETVTGKEIAIDEVAVLEGEMIVIEEMTEEASIEMTGETGTAIETERRNEIVIEIETEIDREIGIEETEREIEIGTETVIASVNERGTTEGPAPKDEIGREKETGTETEIEILIDIDPSDSFAGHEGSQLLDLLT